MWREERFRSMRASSRRKKRRHRLFGWFGDEADFEKGGPEFAGDEEAFVDGVVGDAVEDLAGFEFVHGAEQAFEIDPAEYLAGLRVDAGDFVGLPDVGEEFAFDKFQFIQLIDRFA